MKLYPRQTKNVIVLLMVAKDFADSYRFLSSSLDSLVKTVADNNHKTLGNSTMTLLIMIKY